MRPFVNSPKMEHQSWARNSRRSRCSVCWRSSRCNRSDLRGTVASQRSQQLTRAAPPVPCALRPALWFRRLVRRWLAAVYTSDRKFRISRRVTVTLCSSPQCDGSSSFAAVRFFHEAAFPRFSTNEALTGSVSFNYSVPLPLYMYNVLSTRSRSLAARPAGRTPTLSSVCLSYPPRVLCCQNPCKMAPSDRHRSLCSAFKAAKDSLHRHVKLGPFRALQKSVPMGSFIAVILLAIADSDAA